MKICQIVFCFDILKNLHKYENFLLDYQEKFLKIFVDN